MSGYKFYDSFSINTSKNNYDVNMIFKYISQLFTDITTLKNNFQTQISSGVTTILDGNLVPKSPSSNLGTTDRPFLSLVTKSVFTNFIFNLSKTIGITLTESGMNFQGSINLPAETILNFGDTGITASNFILTANQIKDKIQNQSAVPGTTTINGDLVPITSAKGKVGTISNPFLSTSSEYVFTTSISNLTNTKSITFGEKSIEFSGPISLHKDSTINFGDSEVNISSFVLSAEGINSKIQNQSAIAGTTTISGNLVLPGTAAIVGTDAKPSYYSGTTYYSGTPAVLATPYSPATVTGNITFESPLTFNNSLTFTDAGGWSGDFVPAKNSTRGDIGTKLLPFKNLNLSGKINGNTLFGGVAMLIGTNYVRLENTANSILDYSNTTNPSQIVAGSLDIPANSFEISSFRLNTHGEFTLKKEDQSIEITIKIGDSDIGSITLIPVFGESLITTSLFKLTADISITKVGQQGKIDSYIKLSYYDQPDNTLKTIRTVGSNSTNFNTTVVNKFEIVARCDNTKTTHDSSITTNQFCLTRVY